MAELPQHVGFVGLGAMGLPMAQNLATKLPGSAVLYVYDVVEKVITHLLDEYPGGRVQMCYSAAQVAEKAETIITMLPEGSHVRDVYLSESTGLLSGSPQQRLFIDCSTIDTETSLKIGNAVRENHSSCQFFDAPVSGGVVGAEKGTMTFMLGCAEDDPAVDQIKAILSLMGGNIFPCGGPSLGLTAKLCNNYCSGLIAIATSEAMNIGIKSGMDPRVLSQVFTKSLAGSVINDKWNPVPGVCPDAPASKGYAGGFKVNLMRKDFNLAVETAKRVGAQLALGETGLRVYTEAMEDENCRGLDSRVVFRYLGGEEEWEKKLEKQS